MIIKKILLKRLKELKKRMLPIDTSSYDYKFNKTLNEDVKLKSDQYGQYDISMKNGDYENVTGLESLNNACIIAIMTRFDEIKTETYNEFGCLAHELVKDNQTPLTSSKLEIYITEVLENIRRIDSVDSLTITNNNDAEYNVDFTVTSINDETISGSVTL